MPQPSVRVTVDALAYPDMMTGPRVSHKVQIKDGLGVPAGIYFVEDVEISINRAQREVRLLLGSRSPTTQLADLAATATTTVTKEGLVLMAVQAKGKGDLRFVNIRGSGGGRQQVRRTTKIDSDELAWYTALLSHDEVPSGSRVSVTKDSGVTTGAYKVILLQDVCGTRTAGTGGGVGAQKLGASIPQLQGVPWIPPPPTEPHDPLGLKDKIPPPRRPDDSDIRVPGGWRGYIKGAPRPGS